MSILVQISVLPRQQEDEPFIKELALTKAKLYANDIGQWRIRKRSIDARRVPIKINLQVSILKSFINRFNLILHNMIIKYCYGIVLS